MEIRYTPSGDDAVNAVRASSAPSWVNYLFVLLLFLMFLVGMFLVDHHLKDIGYGWLLITAIIGIAVYQVPRVRAKRILVTTPSAQGEISLSIDDDGIKSSFATGNSNLSWRTYTKYRETADLFILYVSTDRSTMIPKRVMTSEQIKQLRSLLTSKVGKG